MKLPVANQVDPVFHSILVRKIEGVFVFIQEKHIGNLQWHRQNFSIGSCHPNTLCRVAILSTGTVRSVPIIGHFTSNKQKTFAPTMLKVS